MLTLETSVEEIFGVGEFAKKQLAKLGIETIKDLLWYFPWRYDDWSQVAMIKSLRLGQEAVIEAKIISVSSEYSPRKRISIVKAVLQDKSGEIEAVWYNQPFLKTTLRQGDQWYFFGKTSFFNRQMTLVSPLYERQAQILAVYHESARLSSKYFRRIVKIALSANGQIQEFLPEEILQKYNLFDLREAIRNIHFPESLRVAQEAKSRLGFNELFLLSLSLFLKRSQTNKQKSRVCKIDNRILKSFVSNLPFVLTNSQKKSAWQIILDMRKIKPMNRLLQGDVGSGKTVVALFGAIACIEADYQSAWIAPTEILACQHFATAKKLLGRKYRVALLTSAFAFLKAKKISKLKLKEKLKNGEIDLIIGTHALLSDDVKIPKLNFLIIDEQHRFGVKQRAKLLKNGKQGVHFLSMTATPIPRTLTLTLYGDLDVSRLTEKPEGRKQIITQYAAKNKRSQVYEFIKKQIADGRQVFVICPLIEEAENTASANLFDMDRKSVIKEYKKLSQEIFPKYKIAMLHGKMKSNEKQKIMDNFKKNKIQILVSTAVVEVGIDVANASIMMIEGADRFGLAQLHQFRGRVGRAEHQSYCFLFSEIFSAKINERLRAMEREQDGFRLAEIDLKMRGPGSLAGIQQSGMPDLKMASLFDTILVSRARQAAQEIIAQGIDNFPALQYQLKFFDNVSHLE
ncbi:MAG: ATP-dependent DNA helicase RecG [Candidatus Berkelbacteria bacterium Licking1014_7]|uniref:ATP-dependent DNA helicase RecG n=1 Tax=Candidatus Berkelbacteria bacterium Licking1014_7 TaxID=2017147 RepID=A0A554LIM2_9BACT|nr:MAG: ATP-dependent DNA helicase RecG [Candidatus Berkelbacteria bacterium Licking1014_7]